MCKQRSKGRSSFLPVLGNGLLDCSASVKEGHLGRRPFAASADHPLNGGCQKRLVTHPHGKSHSVVGEGCCQNAQYPVPDEHGYRLLPKLKSIFSFANLNIVFPTIFHTWPAISTMPILWVTTDFEIFFSNYELVVQRFLRKRVGRPCISLISSSQGSTWNKIWREHRFDFAYIQECPEYLNCVFS